MSKSNLTSPKAASEVQTALDRLLISDFFAAAADPTRLRLLACLAKCGRACSVSEMAECCDVDFSVVSRHLAILKRGGWVQGVRNGRNVAYAVNYRDLAAFFQKLARELEACGTGRGACCSNSECGPTDGAFLLQRTDKHETE
jgi:ArsR family transcriptional regulator